MRVEASEGESPAPVPLAAIKSEEIDLNIYYTGAGPSPECRGKAAGFRTCKLGLTSNGRRNSVFFGTQKTLGTAWNPCKKTGQIWGEARGRNPHVP